MRITLDFLIYANGQTSKRREVFLVGEGFNGVEDAIKVANIYLKQLYREIGNGAIIDKVVFNEVLDISEHVHLYRLKLVK